MALGNKLKQILDERGITVKDFAIKIGVPPTTLYSFIKRDSQTGKLVLIAKICNGLGIDLLEFLSSDTEQDETGMKVLDLTQFKTEEALNITMLQLLKKNSVMIEDVDTGETEQLKIHSNTLAAHFDGDEFTDEEMEDIRRYAEFVKSKRKQDNKE